MGRSFLYTKLDTHNRKLALDKSFIYMYNTCAIHKQKDVLQERENE